MSAPYLYYYHILFLTTQFLEITIMTSSFLNRNTARSISQAIDNATSLNVGESKIVYATDDLPIDYVLVRNSKGYKNLRLSVAELARDGKRIKIESLNNDGSIASTIFVSEAAINSFISAIGLLDDYIIND
jgi:hydroxypyruvate isomerase